MSPLPLSGLLVLDISTFIAAPAAAVALADYGADVIKIEAPGEGDPHRHNYKRAATYPRSESNFPLQLDGRLKRSLAIDLKKPEARPVLEKLVKRADIMIVNFPPPARERLRLTWEDMQPINPRLVYCSLTGYGETGPDRDRPGFDVTAYFARSGLLDSQRYDGGPPGVPVPAQGDRATAMTLVSAILMALMHREKTGEGTWVGTSLLGNGLWSCGVIAQAALADAYLAPRPPIDRPRSALGNIYRTKDDRWIQLTIVREDKLWGPLARVVGHPELVDDPRFATQADRRARSGELATYLREAFEKMDYAYWQKALADHDVTFGVISRAQDVPHDEQAIACGAVVGTAIPAMPRTLANPVRLGFAEQRMAHPAPALGQHNEEILREAGLTIAEIAALKASGAMT